MSSEEFPLILSPNIGCPEIISVEDCRNGEPFPLIVAGQYCESTSPTGDAFRSAFHLRPSDGAQQEVNLRVIGEPEEIVDWNLLSDFRDLRATREILNSELHYEVLGEHTRYWRVNVAVEDGPDILLRSSGETDLPRLWDLVLSDDDRKSEKVNPHAVQFVRSFEAGCKYIHLTDLHLAKRNDEILDEVLKAGATSGHTEIKEKYVNFNDKFREFIRIANEMADRGELDFVVITGDLVDFTFHGWSDDANQDENNWKTFVNMVTGAGKEGLEGPNRSKNEGLKVAIFTSTGNHDWRLRPYNPKSLGKAFGLSKDDLGRYGYKSFDSSEYPENERAKRVEALRSKALAKLDTRALGWGTRLAKLWSRRAMKYILHLFGLAAGGAGVGGGLRYEGKAVYFVALAVTGVLLVLLYWAGRRWLRKIIDFLVENPLHAEARALHYYLRNINPYLDYAFSYGDHVFIVMDTGADVFVGNLLDGKDVKHLKKISLEDNILGGSPDSRAFDSEQAYCNWSQIVWLEKVLSCLAWKRKKEERRNDAGSRVFVFVHAPPINSRSGGGRCAWQNLWERKRQAKGKTRWIPKDACNLTLGTINHYLSQFFYLCMGHRESDMTVGRTVPSVAEVDLVLAGHAHRNIEFRVDHAEDPEGKRPDIRIYSDVYSELVDKDDPDRWWNDHRPVIVQTAACGLEGETDREPPYFRNIVVDEDGRIRDFRAKNGGGYVKFGP